MSLQQSLHPTPVPKVGGDEEESNRISIWEKPEVQLGCLDEGTRCHIAH